MKKWIAVLLVLGLAAFGLAAYAADYSPARFEWDFSGAEPVVHAKVEPDGDADLELDMFGYEPTNREMEGAVAAVFQAVKAYNRSHGGTGKLSAHTTVDSTGWVDSIEQICTTVHITGEVTGAAKGIVIPCRFLNSNYFHIRWEARLEGNTAGEPLVQCNNIYVEEFAEIRTDGCALSGDSVDVYEASVTGDIRSPSCFLGSTDFTGSIYSDYLNIVWGSVVRAKEIAVTEEFQIGADTEIYLENVELLRNSRIKIEPGAKLDFADRLHDTVLFRQIEEEEGLADYIVYEYTFVGDVESDEDEYYMCNGSYIIPEGSSLTVPGNLHLSYGTIYIAGELHVGGSVIYDGDTDISGPGMGQIVPAQ